jgi:hypothetical protein
VCVDRYNHTSVIPCSDVKSKNACYKYLKRKTKTKKIIVCGGTVVVGL